MNTKIVYKLLPFFLLMIIWGCSKNDDASTIGPTSTELATAAKGVYQISSVTVSGNTTTVTPSSTNTIEIIPMDTNLVYIGVNEGKNVIAMSSVKLTGTEKAINFQETFTAGSTSGNITNGTITIRVATGTVTGNARSASYEASK
ncbi:hypothetical protein [Spirosoma endbachense]|uniref:Lipocalin-like domain-containing protein n=1 Tax=Spirosoma endbachense TaxID=2666025 RepID=A0A6P1VV76_9BACT|nr:hypothetical protein [Spirosoma endbachense]QHV96534.1 hypothetical protein GJR95_16600 [Spirosoma endbachense]